MDASHLTTAEKRKKKCFVFRLYSMLIPHRICMLTFVFRYAHAYFTAKCAHMHIYIYIYIQGPGEVGPGFGPPLKLKF